MSGFVMNIEVRYEDDEGNDLGSNVWAADGATAAVMWKPEEGE